MPQRKLFSPDDKMSDILQSNYRLLPLLPRFGLTLGVGEKTARQLCREKGVDCILMLTVFNLYTHPDYLPAVGQVAALPLEDLLEYLLSSHRYYRQDRIPHIRQHLEQIVAPRPDAEARVMLGFFDQYAHEVISTTRKTPYSPTSAPCPRDGNRRNTTFRSSRETIRTSKKNSPTCRAS